MKQPSEKPAKKPYQPPQLHVYGNLTQLTKTAGKKGKVDGGTGTKRRTG
jgi:hypothetical protein